MIEPDDFSLKQLGQKIHLSPDRERETILAAQAGDLEARNLLIVTNGRLIIKNAVSFKTRMPLIDRCQEGILGLCRAIEKFEVERGLRLSTYATPWIRQRIQRAIVNWDRNIRVPFHMSERLRRLSKAEDELAPKLGRPPTLQELANHLKETPKWIEQAMACRYDTLDLDEPLGPDGDYTLASFVPAKADTENGVDLNLLSEQVETFLLQLDYRKQIILQYRFGLNNKPVLVLREIGDKFGLTRERIRQLEKEALVELREMILEAGIEV